MATHPKGHNCPNNQKYDEERGRCVDKETVDGAENPNSRSKTSSPLTFPSVVLG